MTINSSDLDFYDIKSKLKTYFKQSDEFADYDFEASGLSNIMDVLAYNTHVNGLIANMSINESFLSTSQLRSSVVSHAESLGYFPTSMTAARAVVDVEITVLNNAPTSLPLNAGSKFFVTIDETNYEFFTLQTYEAINDTTGKFVFPNVTLVEGKVKTKTFLADSNIDVPYVISDNNIDVSTMSISVFPNGNSSESNSYFNIKEVATITDQSRVYIVRESMNGFYEVLFGDGNVLGQRPQAGNIISIEYISTSGVEGNGGSEFNLNEYTGEDYSTNISLVSASAGGSSRESISQIKMNAPLAFSAQNRLVTADDYTGMIMSKYGSYLRDVSTWGGNDNIPPQYGKVFVSLNFADGINEESKTTIENLIRSQLTSNLSIMSIDTEFVNPEITYLELVTRFNVDPVKNIPASQLEVAVESIITEYTNLTLSSFDSSFRRSNLLTLIDNHSNAILNSKMEVKVQQRLDIDSIVTDLNVARKALDPQSEDLTFLEKDFTINYPVVIASPDKDDHIIQSSMFKWYDKNVFVRNELGSTRLQLFDVNGDVKLSNAGFYDAAKGTVNLRALRIDVDGYLSSGLKISATPANQSTISPLRNYIIKLDSSGSTVISNTEQGSTKVLL